MEPLNSPPMQEIFGEDYYLRGTKTGLSNYENYQWVPHLTLPHAAGIKKYLEIQDGESALEIGTARGYLVNALRILNVTAFGYDISQWAIENCHPSVKEFVSNQLVCPAMSYDYIIAKDTFEHIEVEELRNLLKLLVKGARKAIFIIVPLTSEVGGKYVCPKDELDPTHKIRWPLSEWINFLQDFDRRMVVNGSYYIHGIKEANTAWENSCGFFTIKRF